MSIEFNYEKHPNYVENYNPMDYVREIPGENGEPTLYLDVKDRMTWFRHKYPNGRVSAKIETFTDRMVVVVAHVYADAANNEGGYLANGHGQRVYDPNGPFSDRFIELAETGARGRALAAAGFNISFGANDAGEGDEQNPVDAPIQKPTAAESTTSQASSSEGDQVVSTKPSSREPVAPAVPPTASDTPAPTKVNTEMTFEQAKNIIVHFGKYENRTLWELASGAPQDLSWIAKVYKGTGEKADTLRTAANLIIDESLKQAS